MSTFYYIRKHATALALLLILLGGWLSVPASLALPEPITCGMVCCEESGECCCFISRQAHEHEEGDEHDETQLMAFQKGCSSDCATLPSFSNPVFYKKSSASLWRIEAVAPNPLPAHLLPQAQWSELSRKSAPRAPPVFS